MNESKRGLRIVSGILLIGRVKGLHFDFSSAL